MRRTGSSGRTGAQAPAKAKRKTRYLEFRVARHRHAIRIAADIAKRVLLIDTLVIQNRDSLDFHNVHVAQVHWALLDAWYDGFDTATKEVQP